jgi:hypothetical protein
MSSVPFDLALPIDIVQMYTSYRPQYPKMAFSDIAKGKTYYFTPQEDITPMESVRIAELFTFGLGVKQVGVKWLEFIENNKLERHFTQRMFCEDL